MMTIMHKTSIAIVSALTYLLIFFIWKNNFPEINFIKATTFISVALSIAYILIIVLLSMQNIHVNKFFLYYFLAGVFIGIIIDILSYSDSSSGKSYLAILQVGIIVYFIKVIITFVPVILIYSLYCLTISSRST